MTDTTTDEEYEAWVTADQPKRDAMLAEARERAGQSADWIQIHLNRDRHCENPDCAEAALYRYQDRPGLMVMHADRDPEIADLERLMREYPHHRVTWTHPNVIDLTRQSDA